MRERGREHWEREGREREPDERVRLNITGQPESQKMDWMMEDKMMDDFESKRILPKRERERGGEGERQVRESE